VHKLAIALLALTLLPPLAAAQDEPEADPTEVKVGLLVINFGNYDANKGTYLLDFYLFFRWDPTQAPANFTPAQFEFMNGRASAKDKIYDALNATTGERELWYRVQANLYSEPQFADFPFDTQRLEILFEDAVHTDAQLVYVPVPRQSGLDDGFRAAGWRVREPTFEVIEKDYKFEETYSRAKFTIELSRERFSTAIKSLLPPAAFILVAALQFFIHPSKWNNRLGLGTGMLISSVMFHISQTVALPPMARLILFDKVMIAVYLFVVGSLAVTTLIAIDEDWWKDRDHTRKINLYGAAVTIFVSGAALILLLRFG
jgi:hypothetical protein